MRGPFASIRGWLAVLVTAGCLFANAREVRVEATGAAPGNYANARGMALTYALNAAVRKGGGVTIWRGSGVEDFVLAYDRIFTESIGYVRDYRVIAQELGHDGLYRVTISALVGKSQLNEEQVLRMLMARQGQPRVKIEVSGEIANLRAQPDLAGLMRELANHWQMNVVDLEALSDAELRRRERDRMVGDDAAAEARRVRANHDFLIRLRLRGRYEGEQDLGGMRNHIFVIGADLSAVWAASAENVAEVAIDSVRVTSAQGAQDAIARTLRGRIPATREKNADTLFRRVVARYVTELDLGTRYTLEFKGIDEAALNAAKAQLEQTEGVGLVAVKEFDSRLLSTLLVESTLKPMALAEVVRGALPGWQTDRSEATYLQFRRDGATTGGTGTTSTGTGTGSGTGGTTSTGGSTGTGSGTGTGGTTAANSDGGLPPWLWALVGGGAVLIIGGAFVLGRRSG